MLVAALALSALAAASDPASSHPVSADQDAVAHAGDHGSAHQPPSAGASVAHLGSEHHESTKRTIVALRGLACFHCQRDDPAPMYGGGAFVEFAAIPHKLAFELSGSYVARDGYSEIPVEALIKLPIAVSEVVEVSPGLGGMVVDLPAHHEWVGGIIGNVDVFFWNHHNLGVLLEADGMIHFEEEPLALVEFGTGLAARF